MWRLHNRTIIHTNLNHPAFGSPGDLHLRGLFLEPNFHNGQPLKVDVGAYVHAAPRRGDVILFRGTPAGSPNINFIKRVIGLPGETVAVYGRTVYINGRPLTEPFRISPPDYKFPASCLQPGKAASWCSERIPKNHYFVLGDNRNNSEDSHIWKWLPRKDIIGKVIVSK